MAAKRSGDDNNTKIDKIITELKTNEKFHSEIENQLLSFKSSAEESPSRSSELEVSNEATKVEENKKEELFDIKLLNDIDDRVIRGTLKKVYMAGKRNSKVSNEIISDMKNRLNEDGKLDDKLKVFLEGIVK